jgi:hypothetical protein
MIVWTCWLQAEDGTTWLEGAMDDDATAENHSAWQKIVDDAAKIAHESNDYSMRVVAVHVPFDAILNAFKIPEVNATQVVPDEGSGGVS